MCSNIVGKGPGTYLLVKFKEHHRVEASLSYTTGRHKHTVKTVECFFSGWPELSQQAKPGYIQGLVIKYSLPAYNTKGSKLQYNSSSLFMVQALFEIVRMTKNALQSHTAETKSMSILLYCKH